MSEMESLIDRLPLPAEAFATDGRVQESVLSLPQLDTLASDDWKLYKITKVIPSYSPNDLFAIVNSPNSRRFCMYLCYSS